MAKGKSWHEEDAFWEIGAPVLFARRQLSEAPAEVDRIISLLDLRPGAYILDLCCGVGRHALELARRGFMVTGTDRTLAYLERAEGQAKAEELEAEFVQEDMRKFCRPDTFSAVINLYTSFGYFEDPEEDRRVGRNVYKSLKPGGVFLMDMMGKEVLARIFQERVWREEDGILILEERKLSPGWDRIEARWIIYQDDRRRELRFSTRLYSAVELASLLQECGFTDIDLFGDLGGGPYDHNAKRLVAVARK